MIPEVKTHKYVFSQMSKQLSFQYVGSVNAQSFCNFNEASSMRSDEVFWCITFHLEIISNTEKWQT